MRPPAPDHSPPRPESRSLLRYAVVWAAVGAALVAVALGVVSRLGGDEVRVSLPPLRGTELTSAARSAGCELRTPTARVTLNPDVSGPPGTPARPGVHDPPPSSDQVVAALRRGVIVIQYRPGIPDDQVRELEALQRAVPGATIVAPNTSMPYEVAASGWRRLLGCPRYSSRSIDAMRLFRGRFIGRGPDR